MEAKQEKEGRYLLGQPTFRELENGRFQCVETGHELPTHMKKSYADTKHCRLGLIDAAFAAKKPPLNMFSQDPASRSKLICKLTGDIVNKTEEHIWKHINGRRFLNMLEKKEIEKQTPNAAAAMVVEKSPQKTKKKKNKSSKLKSKLKGKEKHEDIEEKDNSAEMQDSSEKEESGDFWMPDVGERWDFDNGADRWVSGSESESESDSEPDGQVNEEDENETDDDDDVVVANADEENGKEETLEISKRAKRMCIEVGPSNLPPKKKKKKTTK